MTCPPHRKARTPPGSASPELDPKPEKAPTRLAPRRAAPQPRESILLSGYARFLLCLPYPWRVRLAGWLAGVVQGRSRRQTGRIANQIARVLPDLPATRHHQLAVEVLRNSARSQIELLSGRAFRDRAATAPLSGPGLDALMAAHRAGRPAILLVSHFGNSAAMAAALDARGIEMATFFRPLPVPAIDRIYRDSLLSFTRPLFPYGRAGIAAMLRHLRSGGKVTISFDLDRPEGVLLDFLDRPTRTMLSMAEMALRHDALLIPVYGLRNADGLSFTVVIDSAIAHDEPKAMMQAAGDSLAAMVRTHPEQWLWWHRRWKSNETDGQS